MIKFYEPSGESHFGQATITRTTSVNGGLSLTGEVFAGDDVLTGLDYGWWLNFDNENYVITYKKLSDDTNTIVFDAVQKFFWDFAKVALHSEYNGSHTYDFYLKKLFSGSGYTYQNDVNVPAFEKENWGYKNKLSLFNDIMEQADVEFEVHNETVHIAKQIGSDLTSFVRKGINLSDLTEEMKISDFATYAKGYGTFKDSDDQSKGRLEVEYRSELANRFGDLEMDPIVDERYTVANNLIAELKKQVDATYTVSMTMNIYDLENAGYPNYESPKVGDWILAIDEALNFKRKIRIIELEEQFDVTGKRIGYTATCGDLSIVDQYMNIQGSLDSRVQSIQRSVDDVAISADGKSSNYYGAKEPASADDGDLWFDQSNSDPDKWSIKQWANGRWEQLTLNPGEVDAKVSVAKKAVDADIAAANAELDVAKQDVANLQVNLKANDDTQAQLTKDLAANSTLITQNKADVDVALDTVNNNLSQAQADTATAVKNADSAVANAQSAVDASGLANTTANAASDAASAAKQLSTEVSNNFAIVKTQAATAVNDAATALDQAKSAVDKAESTASEFGKVSQKTDSAVASALAAQNAASSAVSQASSAAADSKDAKQIAGEVSQSYKTLTDGSTMTIAELEGGLAVKLTRTDLNGYATQDWSQNQIKLTADGIKDTMSSIKGTVDSHTTNINDLKADSSSFKSQFTTVNNTIGKQTTDIGTLQASSKELTTGFNTLTTDNGTNKNNISQLKQTATEVSSTLETVKTQVKNSAVGTNLLANTADNGIGPVSIQGDTSDPQLNATMTRNDSYIEMTNPTQSEMFYRFCNTDPTIHNLEPGQTYTIQGEVYVSKGIVRFRSQYQANGGWTDYPGCQSGDLATNTSGFVKVSYTFTIPSNATAFYISWQVWDYDSTTVFRFRRTKLEIGENATDYSVNPLDNATVTAVSKLSQTVDGMQTDISKKIEQKDLNGYATETWSQNQIKITADGINGTLSKKIEKTDLNGYATETWTQNQIKTSADGLSATFAKKTDLATTASNLKLTADGLNLLTTATGTNGEKVTQVIADVNNIKSTMTGPNGYTTRLQTLEGFQQTATSQIAGKATTSQLTQLSNQLTSTIGNISSAGSNLVVDGGFESGKTNGLPQLYSGTAGDKPAPSGTWAAYMYSSNIQANDDKIWYWTLPKPITLQAGHTYIMSYDYCVSGIVGAASDWPIDETGNPIFGIAMEHQAHIVDADAAKRKWHRFVGKAYTALKNIVIAKIRFGYMAALGGAGWKLVDNVQIQEAAVATPYQPAPDENSSTFTQLQDRIDQRVMVDGKIAAALSLSADGGGTVTIRGASLYVTAASHFDNASIQSAAIANLDAAKITSGSISSDRLVTTKLNADNITSGSIAAERIATTALSATNITSGTLDVGKLTVKNLSADLIASGTIDASKITVKNLSASNIIGGELDAGLVNVKNLSASKLTAGTIDANNIDVVNLNASNITTGTITGIDIISQNAQQRVEMYNGTVSVTDGVTSTNLSSSGFINHRTIDTYYLSFVSQGMSIKADSANTGLARNAGLELYGDTSYLDFHDSVSATDDYGARISFDEYYNKELRVFNPSGNIQIRSKKDAPINLQGAAVNIRNDNNTGWVTAYASTFSSQSAHSLKENFQLIDDNRLLQAVTSTDIVGYNFKGSSQRYCSFVINDDGLSPYYTDPILIDDGGTSFNSTTVTGVMMGAIKALNSKLNDLNTKYEAVVNYNSYLLNSMEEPK